jgi:hypothetical protein
MHRSKLFLASVAVLAIGAPALAHTPYLVPTTFAPDRDYVTLQGGLSETDVFVPDFPIRGGGDFWATGPSGEAVKIGPGLNMKEWNVIEAPLPQEGTWKISTGERAGRTFRYARAGDEWKVVEASAAAPGGEVVENVRYVIAETYVTRGAPSKGALKATGKGFELVPATHPNEIFAGDEFKFTLTFDGKPVAGAAFEIARAGDAYAEKRYGHSGKTDASGQASVRFAEPGAYLLETSYGMPQPGVKPNARSLTYGLSFEVTR